MTMNTIKGTGDFSRSFWRFIKEDIGIHNVYPEGKRKISLKERQAKVDQLLEKVDFNDDKLTPGESLLEKWSDEALDLYMMIKKLGNMPEFCVEDYLINFFETLYFPRLGIEKLDSTLSRMSHLQILNLSYNRITVIPQTLPPGLQELNLTGNLISEV